MAERAAIAPRRAARQMGVGALVGLATGASIGVGEVARLVWSVPGMVVPPIFVLDAVVIDGTLGAVLGLTLALLLALASCFGRRARASRRRCASAADPAATRRSFVRAGALAAGSLGLLSMAPAVAAVSRRAGTPGRRVGATGRSMAAPDDATASPSVIFVTIDTLRADQLGCYGHPFVATPALDGFARQGARFTLHTVQEPQTNPSHGSMFTGMYPSSSGMRVHMRDKLPDSLDSMATLFLKAGYRTAGLYSWMSFDPVYTNYQRGFQTYRNLAGGPSALTSEADLTHAAAHVRVAEDYLAIPRGFALLTGYKPGDGSDAKGRADVTTDAAIAQLRAFGSSPCFLWVHYFDPHYPYQPPGKYATMYDPGYRGPVTTEMRTVYDIEQGRLRPTSADVTYLMSQYQGEISYLDSQLGRLFGALDALGRWSNTLVVVTGDHGEGFGDHSDMEETSNFFHPHSLYREEQVVPLLVRYPGRVRAGTVVTAPTQAIDLLPTMLEYAGLPAPPQAQGASLVPLLDGRDSGATRRAFSAMPDYVFTSLTTPAWKIIRNNADGQYRLFNLVADPGERADVARASPDTAARLSAELTSWMKAVKIS